MKAYPIAGMSFVESEELSLFLEPIEVDVYDELGYVETIVLDGEDGNMVLGLAASILDESMIGDAYGAETGLSFGIIRVRDGNDTNGIQEPRELWELPVAVRNRIQDIQAPGFEVFHSHDFGAFNNNEGLLPANGHYQEIYVTGQNGDSRLLVYDWNSDTLYYSPDHYDTFIPVINPWTLGGPAVPMP